MIPDKNLFIITSAIKPSIGVFNFETRFNQTVASVKSVREKVPDAIIVLADVSLQPLTDMERQILSQYCNLHIDLSGEQVTRDLSQRGMKSQAENVLLFNTLMTIKNNPDISKILYSVKSIFKFSARTILEDSFNIHEYDNLFGKFVFKKRIPTWMGQTQHGADHLLITRMYSFCISLLDTYLTVIHNNLRIMDVIDTEHAHFVNIPKNHLIEFDKIHCWGWLAGNGQIEHY